MLYAYLESGDKVRARPGLVAYCPDCQDALIAKCGQINIWHWAHAASTQCDAWHEPETEWHLNWKLQFPPHCVEVSMSADGVKHRADILTPSGTVIELQHSPIAPNEIYARESFYKNMVWIFDAIAPYEAGRLQFRDRRDYFTFRWKQPRKHIAATTCPVFLDIGHWRMFLLRKMYSEVPCGGWGEWQIKSDWLYAHMQIAQAVAS